MPVKMTVILEEPDAAAVHAVAIEDGISGSALIARAVDDYLMRRVVDRLNAFVRVAGADAIAAEHRAEDVEPTQVDSIEEHT
ncbi:hypothetical protein [Glycomyces sp. YM15]|uniref:hypothetical protein n=1 Tax=Glycomyces sp. YM15 TaxID=2800446 RepID=UPI0019661DEA|nr:hypothetical protein [Glycomyces sp. YM15]